MPDKAASISQKQNSEKWKKRTDKQNAKSTANMSMAEGDRSKQPMTLSVDSERPVAQTQERLSRALKRRYQYESNLKPAQEFLLAHVNSKIPLVIMYADLVGSTKMSMTLPVDKMVTIIRAFLYEMSYIVQSHKGYVLKYVGDAVIAFFPSIYDKLLACDMAVRCAKSMITITEKGINQILHQYDYAELKVKIGLDEGENVIVQYGHDKSSLIDILGYSMSISAKITSLSYPNTITIGEDVYSTLSPQMRMKFKEVKFSIEHWKYVNSQTGQLYKLYADNNNNLA
ncbi:MAG TPA: adenylate/guanylate cyclase domain-containing protein [Nitrososphaeraceae archaeon]|nr:adenylate/guanylate cyclase domain-containing protein [Nitrososphaeraceae archaeon]